jgi:3-oxoacyl-[acyl-carrier protein] reductase
LDEGKAQAVTREIESFGGRALAVGTDVSRPESVEEMAARVKRDLGRIDILVNNAGIFSTLKMRPFEQIPIEEWDRVLHVNVTGVMLCCRAVTPTMREVRWGRIINISSGSISLGRPNYLHYTTSKSALIGMTRSMARELGAYGITVNAVLPGPVFTEIPRETVTLAQKEVLVGMQCVPRAEEPRDLIGTMLFLASEGSGFVTGQSITVDGGATHS